MIFQYRPVIHSKGSKLNFYQFLLSAPLPFSSEPASHSAYPVFYSLISFIHDSLHFLKIFVFFIIYHLQSIYIKIYVICRQKLLVNKARYLLTILSFKYQDLFYLQDFCQKFFRSLIFESDVFSEQ